MKTSACGRSLLAVTLWLFAADFAAGQFVPVAALNRTPGVYLDVSGQVKNRETDETGQLAAMKARLKASASSKNLRLKYISLPRLFAQVKSLREANKPLPEELRFLGGLTQIRYVFVVPEEKDLLIAGPSEPFSVVKSEGDSVDFAIGQTTGRPVLQLDDVIIGLRTARDGFGNVFGCGIWPSPETGKIAHEVVQSMARNTREERIAALKEKLAPQAVQIFGTRADTRFAYICVAADYEMKRMAIGVEKPPVPLGNAMDNSRSAANKIWFEANYLPLLVSKDGNSFEIRGQRLGLGCGAFDFDKRGATETAKRWTNNFSKQMPQLCSAVPLYAELQNIADEALLGNLILRDRLADKAGWDVSWLFDSKACPVETIPTPKTCETIVSFTSGSLVAGGVSLSLSQYLEASSRQPDDGATLDTPRKPAAAPAASAGQSIFRE